MTVKAKELSTTTLRYRLKRARRIIYEEFPYMGTEKENRKEYQKALKELWITSEELKRRGKLKSVT
jgi:hypothetical protein